MTMQMSLGQISVDRVPGSERWVPGHVGHQMLLSRVDLNGVGMPFGRNAEVYGEGEPAEYVYKVLSGAVRTYKVLSDGRRQIIGFYLPGDVLGFDPGDEHSCSAEAITASQVFLVRRTTLFKAAERDADIARCLWALTATELKRSQQHALLLIKSAQERLATFLLDIAERLSAKNEFDLPMSRQDIADHLGLTIETVSRTLTQLADSSIIQFLASRRILLRNRSMLSEMNA
jgi:CRP/FNR family transcriptional regulator, nitrogen fixation regulation protein